MEKINVAELLKNCPSGIELDSPMYDSLYFGRVEEDYRLPISCYTMYHGSKTSVYFTEFGSCNEHKTSKCVIFPKGKTTWEGFVPPCQFKDGDIIFTHANCLKAGVGNTWISIFKERRNGGVATYVDYAEDGSDYYSDLDGDKALLCMESDILRQRFATEEEKEKLFKAIEDNGYKWNPETKTLEKLIQPQFKVENVIQDKDGYKVRVTEVNIEDECYGYESVIVKGIGGISFREQDDWELVPNKFDISALKPFDKVLVRDNSSGRWDITFYELYDNTNSCYPHRTLGGNIYKYCIPYEGNEHLLGKVEDCKNFYKIWE